MKVFVSGGYGKAGILATQLLAASGSITQIAVVGRDLERAEKAAAELGEMAITVQIDGTDEGALACAATFESGACSLPRRPSSRSPSSMKWRPCWGTNCQKGDWSMSRSSGWIEAGGASG